ncbi:hypothetical protein RFI_36232 [Reticulomyxa filosa]|uniref:Uncharacterized protein n=1 Tax=Reticulomyxa filosa TaxID=46433 RepID=X6LHW2_RETFI|nr:hypothetical protein RFI_36232 [Reticulomyxa filosa]|eukprot:ETO01209.1 hypothetical protein RFI_36232 [Reticulomyxa filosa]
MVINSFVLNHLIKVKDKVYFEFILFPFSNLFISILFYENLLHDQMTVFLFDDKIVFMEYHSNIVLRIIAFIIFIIFARREYLSLGINKINCYSFFMSLHFSEAIIKKFFVYLEFYFPFFFMSFCFNDFLEEKLNIKDCCYNKIIAWNILQQGVSILTWILSKVPFMKKKDKK